MTYQCPCLWQRLPIPGTTAWWYSISPQETPPPETPYWATRRTEEMGKEKKHMKGKRKIPLPECFFVKYHPTSLQPNKQLHEKLHCCLQLTIATASYRAIHTERVFAFYNFSMWTCTSQRPLITAFATWVFFIQSNNSCEFSHFIVQVVRVVGSLEMHPHYYILIFGNFILWPITDKCWILPFSITLST